MEHFYSAGRILVKAGWLAAFELTRFQKKDLFKNEKYPVSEFMHKNGFYIPSGLGLDKKQIEYVAKTLKDILS